MIEKYTHLRHIRGDGNCFYRSFLVAYLEKNFHDRDELLRFKANIDYWKEQLQKHGFDSCVLEDFCSSVGSAQRMKWLSSTFRWTRWSTPSSTRTGRTSSST